MCDNHSTVFGISVTLDGDIKDGQQLAWQDSVAELWKHGSLPGRDRLCPLGRADHHPQESLSEWGAMQNGLSHHQGRPHTGPQFYGGGIRLAHWNKKNFLKRLLLAYFCVVING